PDSNRGWRICNPLPFRLAKGPVPWSMWIVADPSTAVNVAPQAPRGRVGEPPDDPLGLLALVPLAPPPRALLRTGLGLRLAAVPGPRAQRHFRREGLADRVAARRTAPGLGEGGRARAQRTGRRGPAIDPFPSAG